MFPAMTGVAVPKYELTNKTARLSNRAVILDFVQTEVTSYHRLNMVVDR